MVHTLDGRGAAARAAGDGAPARGRSGAPPERTQGDLVAGTNTRLYIVGGAGSLYVDAAHKTQLLDTPDFPAEFYPLAKAQTEELAALRSRKDAHWIFVSPAADFAEDGVRTGKYKLGGEELTLSSAGESVISYADYAVGMADLSEKNDLSGVRVSLVET